MRKAVLFFVVGLKASTKLDLFSMCLENKSKLLRRMCAFLERFASVRLVACGNKFHSTTIQEQKGSKQSIDTDSKKIDTT